MKSPRRRKKKGFNDIGKKKKRFTGRRKRTISAGKVGGAPDEKGSNFLWVIFTVNGRGVRDERRKMAGKSKRGRRGKFGYKEGFRSLKIKSRTAREEYFVGRRKKRKGNTRGCCASGGGKREEPASIRRRSTSSISKGLSDTQGLGNE